MIPRSFERYQRQMLLQEFGFEGQQKMSKARVLVIGAGGLGCPALQYLAAAGTGTLGIVDDDAVALHNLHRQVLYSVAEVGQPKAMVAARVLSRLNPEITLVPYQTRLDTHNALELIGQYDIVLDGTDNFATRYMINDACVLLDRPLVYGAISQFEGQVAVFQHADQPDSPKVNYRDIFPVPPKDGEVLNCAEAGVLGVVPGIIGTMMASETIKWITGMETLLSGKLFTYNVLSNESYLLELSPGAETRSLIPANEEAFRQTDYAWLCAALPSADEIELPDLIQLVSGNQDVGIVDVREPGEIPPVTELETVRIPLGKLSGEKDLARYGTIVLLCQTGQRSLKAARMLQGIYGNSKKIYSLKGGILQWKNNQAPA